MMAGGVVVEYWLIAVYSVCLLGETRPVQCSIRKTSRNYNYVIIESIAGGVERECVQLLYKCSPAVVVVLHKFTHLLGVIGGVYERLCRLYVQE